MSEVQPAVGPSIAPPQLQPPELRAEPQAPAAEPPTSTAKPVDGLGTNKRIVEMTPEEVNEIDLVNTKLQLERTRQQLLELQLRQNINEINVLTREEAVVSTRIVHTRGIERFVGLHRVDRNKLLCTLE